MGVRKLVVPFGFEARTILVESPWTESKHKHVENYSVYKRRSSRSCKTPTNILIFPSMIEVDFKTGGHARDAKALADCHSFN